MQQPARDCLILTLPWPPSVNAMWRTPTKGPLAGRTLLSEDGRNYRKAVAEAMLIQRPGRLGAQRVAVDIEARLPDRRRRDMDNLAKGPLDALTHAGLWEDDSQIDDLRVWRSAVPHQGGALIVRVSVIVQPQAELIA